MKIRKRSLALIAATCLAFGLLAASARADDASQVSATDSGDQIETTASFWYTRTSWAGYTSATGITGDLFGTLYYRINDSPTTAYAGTFFDKNKDLAGGIDVNVDNNIVGKLRSVLAFVGVGHYYVRLQSANLVGHALWDGSTAVSGITLFKTQPVYDINTKYQEIDLDYQFQLPFEDGGYTNDPLDPAYATHYIIGVGYSRLTMPMLLSGQLNNTATLPYFYTTIDPASQLRFYTVNFGMDTLNWGSIKKFEGYGMWLYTQDRFGRSDITISPSVQQSIPNNSVPSSISAEWLEATVTLGVQWSMHSPGYSLGVGVGINYSDMSIFGAGSGNAISALELRSHGPQLKVIGDW